MGQHLMEKDLGFHQRFNMKRIYFILIFLLACFFANAQFPLTQSVGNKNMLYATQGAFGADSGYVYRYAFADTSAANLGYLKNIPGIVIRTIDDKVWMRNNAATEWVGVGSVSDVSNGLRIVSDTIKIGGTFTDSVTHLQIAVGAKTDQNTVASSKVYVLSNRTLAQDQSLSDWVYWQQRGGNALQWYQRLFFESEGDTAVQQYNGVVNSFNRYTLDFSSSRFDSANGRTVNMQYGGAYFINQLYPTKNIVIAPSSFGRDGSAFAGVLGFGKDSSYTITLAPSSTTPWPLTVYHSEIDFNRAVPSNKSRIFRTGGVGIGNFTAGWKSYQSSLGVADTLNPSYISLVFGFKSQGSIYAAPFNGSGFTKSRILARSMVDTMVAFWAPQLYSQTNEVRNGFAFWNQGPLDWNYYAGLSRFGGSMPDRATGDTIAHVAEFFGNVLMEGANNLRFRAASPGAFPGMFWQIKDTSGSQGSIDYQTSSNRDSRRLIIASGTSNAATTGYSNNGVGFTIDLRTGSNGVNTTRMFRNGNTVFGTLTNVNDYYNFSKVAVVGDLLVTDTVFFRRTPLVSTGTGFDVVMRRRSDSALYVIPYDSISGGGGSAVYFARNDARNNTAASMYFSAADQSFTIDSVNGASISGYDNGLGRSYLGIDNGGNATLNVLQSNDDYTTAAATSEDARIQASNNGGQSFRFMATYDSAVINYPVSYFSSDTTKYKIMARSATGGLVNVAWPVGAVNLGNSDLTQTDATRNFDIDGQNLYFLNTGTFRIYGSGANSGQRMIDLDGSTFQGYFGPNAGVVSFGFNADSLLIDGIGLRNDTTNNKILVWNPSTNTISYANWLSGGGGGGITSINSQTGPAITLAVGTAGTDFAVSASSNTITFDLPDASASARGVITTGTQALVGNKIFGGAILANGGIYTGTAPTNANFWINSASGGTSTNNAAYLFGAGATTGLRTGFRGSAGYNIAANNDYANIIMAEMVANEASSGTHSLIAGMALRPPSITDNAASVTNTATLFIESAPSTTVTGGNFAILVEAGDVGVAGTSGSTFRWSGTAANTPLANVIGTPTGYYGASGTNILGTPDAWVTISINGTEYVLPAYLPNLP